MNKIILVGESNPYGADPYYALYPAPDGCAGNRLCCYILGMHRHVYLETFDRTNLCEGKWSSKEARQRAHELCMQHERLILLGAKVASAFSMVFEPFMRVGIADVTKRHPRREALILPHPSGLCRLWHVAGSMQRARDLVGCFAPELAPLLGVML